MEKQFNNIQEIDINIEKIKIMKNFSKLLESLTFFLILVGISVLIEAIKY